MPADFVCEPITSLPRGLRLLLAGEGPYKRLTGYGLRVAVDLFIRE